jgi:hypothetical protein
MPIRRMLDGAAFDSKTVAVLTKAFDDVVAELELLSEADREQAAKIVLGLASGQSDIDAEDLRAKAVRLMRSVA